MVDITDAILVYCFNLVPSVDAVPVIDFVVADGQITSWDTSKLGAQPDSGTLGQVTQNQVDYYFNKKAGQLFPIKSFIFKGKVGATPVKIISGVKRFNARILTRQGSSDSITLTIQPSGDLVAICSQLNPVDAYIDLIYA